MARDERTISQINASFPAEWWHWEGQSWPSGPFGGTPCSTHLQDYGTEASFGWLVCVLVAQPCPTLWDPTNCSPWGFSVHGILQARILEWIAIPFSRGSSWPRDRTWVSRFAGRFFTIWATGKFFGWLEPWSFPLSLRSGLQGD